MNFGFKSFYWCLGTTSFRTKNFNKRIEQQLSLLRDFWAIKENAKREWNEQNGVQTAYYDFLHASGFIYGDAKNKPKDAREKTSGLAALGLIDDDRRLTEVGQALLTISEQNNFDINNILGLPADSFIYFKQLLKTSIKFDGENLRPFIVTVYLISKLNGLSYEDYKYLFEDDKVILDTIPKHYFAPICNDLVEIAFESSMSLNKNSELHEIAQFLQPDEKVILVGINREFSLNLTSLQEADEILEKQRYLRFSRNGNRQC